MARVKAPRVWDGDRALGEISARERCHRAVSRDLGVEATMGGSLAWYLIAVEGDGQGKQLNRRSRVRT
jgi:hypothetical protein